MTTIEVTEKLIELAAAARHYSGDDSYYEAVARAIVAFVEANGGDEDVHL